MTLDQMSFFQTTNLKITGSPVPGPVVRAVESPGDAFEASCRSMFQSEFLSRIARDSDSYTDLLHGCTPSWQGSSEDLQGFPSRDKMRWCLYALHCNFS